MSPGTSCAAHTSHPIAAAGKTRTTQLSATPQVNTRNGFRRRSATRVAGKSCPRRIVFVRCQSIRREGPGVRARLAEAVRSESTRVPENRLPALAPGRANLAAEHGRGRLREVGRDGFPVFSGVPFSGDFLPRSQSGFNRKDGGARDPHTAIEASG